MKLIKILSDRIQIRTTQREFENIRINDLVSISDDTVELVTMVTSVTESESEAGFADDDEPLLGGVDMKVIECSIIGSVHDGKFSNAIDKYPVTNVKAEEITAEEFKKMIAYANGKGFQIGSPLNYDNCDLADCEKYFKRKVPVDNDRKVEIGKTYRHFKGHTVKVLHIAQDTEAPGQFYVVYECEDGAIWSRPYGMFVSEVDHVKYPNVKQKYRFELVGGEDDE